MIAKLIPLVIGLAGLGAGVGAGVMLRPSDDAAQMPVLEAASEGAGPCGEATPASLSKPAPVKDDRKAASEFVKLSNQFVFPLIDEGKVTALVVLMLTLEVAEGQGDAVLLREPILRDGFLRVLLDHANAGGFDGVFTSALTLDNLRTALIEKGRQELGDALYDVLILDINRQDA